MKFTKMHGIGNDYIYVNCFEENVAAPAQLAKVISDRHRGVGADGLILVCPSEQGDVRMEMYNADGSRAQMCGNGIRCVAKFAYERGLSRSNPMHVETDSGVLNLDLTLDDSRVRTVRVDVGKPRLHPSEIPARFEGERIVDQRFPVGVNVYKITCVSMGNPHVVAFVDDLPPIDLAVEGPAIEHHELFPERTNAHFAEVLSPTEARMITWERGSGATQACGTGACAVLVAGVLTGRLQGKSIIHLPGGDLEIEWGQNEHVYMTGPAEEVFTGEWNRA